MSDRTWNHIDARLYEEDWSEEAIIIAACMIARCPNQYGVFDTPMGFLTKFFRNFFAREQIELVLTELESAGFLKFYNDKQITWIVAKWKRAHKPSANHWKGANTHLKSGYNPVIEDFTAYYERYWDSIGIPLGGSGEPPPNTMPKSDSESESDSDSEIKDKIKLHCPAKTAGRKKAQKKNKPREKKEPKPNEPSHIWLAFFQFEFKKRKGHEPNLLKGDRINAYTQYNALIKLHEDRIIRAVAKYYLDQNDDVWKGHKPHVFFKNFDRLLEGMMEYQKKFKKHKDEFNEATDLSRRMKQWEADPHRQEIPNKYKPEATPDET